VYIHTVYAHAHPLSLFSPNTTPLPIADVTRSPCASERCQHQTAGSQLFPRRQQSNSLEQQADICIEYRLHIHHCGLLLCCSCADPINYIQSANVQASLSRHILSTAKFATALKACQIKLTVQKQDKRSTPDWGEVRKASEFAKDSIVFISISASSGRRSWLARYFYDTYEPHWGSISLHLSKFT
jgi:hypothetical protein